MYIFFSGLDQELAFQLDLNREYRNYLNNNKDLSKKLHVRTILPYINKNQNTFFSGDPADGDVES